MKVLYAITRAERGGGQAHVADLLRGLRGEIEPELAVGEEGYLTQEADALRIRWHLVRGLVQPVRPLKDLQAIFEFLRIVDRTSPDLIHAHTSKAGLVGRIGGYIKGIPTIFTAHTWCFAEGVSRQRQLVGAPLERLACRITARVINVSEANRQLALCQRIGSAERLVTIHNGVEPWEASLDERKSEPPTIAMVARLAPQKDHETLLRALAGVNLPFRVWLIGEGPCRTAIEELSHKLDLTSKVTLLGDRSDVPKLLAQASIFALVSHWEGFPLSILEAMRAGLPIVASNVGGVSEAVTEGVNGFLLSPRDILKTRQVLGRLLSNPSLLRAMGEASRIRFNRLFTSDQMLQKTLGVYREAIDHKTALRRFGETAKHSNTNRKRLEES